MRKLKPEFFNSEKGIILPIVIVMMVALVIIGIAFLNAGLMENTLARREIHKNQAFYLADAGIDHLLVRLKRGGQPANIGPVTLGKGTYEVVASYTGAASAVSTGKVEENGQIISKKIKVDILSMSAWDYAIFGDEKVKVQGSSLVDSANPASPAWVATNSTEEGGIELVGNALIDGSVWVGAGGNPDTVIVGNDDQITIQPSRVLPTKWYFDPVVPPTYAILMEPISLPSGTQTISSTEVDPVYSYPSIDVKGELNIDTSYTIVVGTMEITGNGKIVIASGVSVDIYIVGEYADLGGTGIVNLNKDPSTLRIHATEECQTINLHGTADLYAVVYAPDTDIIARGDSYIFGSLLGKTIDIWGNPIVRWDPRLAKVPIYYFISLGNWREIPS